MTPPVGYWPVAIYELKDKAIYWDGRNDYGERVASGIYFYTLTANDFTATIYAGDGRIADFCNL